MFFQLILDMRYDRQEMDDGCGRRHEAWLRAELASRRGYADAYRLRFAVFVLWVLLMAALVWWGVRLAAPAVLEFQENEQERLEAEDAGLRAAYDAEALYGLERSTMYNVQCTMEEGDAE